MRFSSRRACAALALAVVVSAGAAHAASQATSGTPARAGGLDETNLSAVVDSAGLTPTVDCCYQTQTDSDSTGDDVAVTWLDMRGDAPDDSQSTREVELSQSFDGGSSWEPLLNLNRADGLNADGWDHPRVAIGPTATVVGYLVDGSDNPEGVGGLATVRVGRDGTRSTTRTEWIGSDFEVANNGGTGFHVVYAQTATPSYLVVLSSHDDGRTWDEPFARQIPDFKGEQVPPVAIAADGDVVAASYAAGAGGVDHTWVAVSTNGGRTFGEPNIIGGGQTVEDIAVAVHGRTVVAAAAVNDGSGYYAYFTYKSTDGGETFGSGHLVARKRPVDGSPVERLLTLDYESGAYTLTVDGAADTVWTSPDATTWRTWPFAGVQAWPGEVLRLPDGFARAREAVFGVAVPDNTKPTLRAGKLPATTKAAKVPWRLQATDDESGVDYVTVRMRRGSGAWTTPSSWRRLSATASVDVPVGRGSSVTVLARAFDKAGNASAWSKAQTVRRR